jgi:hypothetical protein
VDRPRATFHSRGGYGAYGLRDRPDTAHRPPDAARPLHDLAFVLFVLALLPAFFFLWRRFREDPAWRGHARYTLATGMIATLLLLLPGVAYYLFTVVVLVWTSVTGAKLWRSTG